MSGETVERAALGSFTKSELAPLGYFYQKEFFLLAVPGVIGGNSFQYCFFFAPFLPFRLGGFKRGIVLREEKIEMLK